MEYTDEILEERILWFAARNDLPKRNALLFKDLKPEDQEKFYSIIRAAEIGFPVVLFLAKKGKWSLLGTRKVVSGSFEGSPGISDFFTGKRSIGAVALKYDFISYSNIEHYDLKVAKMLDDHKFSYGRRRFIFDAKREWRIVVTEEGGREVIIYGSKGRKLYRMTNIITMILWMLNDV